MTTCSGLGFVLPPPWRLQTAVTPGELPGGGGTPRQDHRCQPSQVYIPCGADGGLLRAPSPESSKLEALGSPSVASFPPLARFFGTYHLDENRRRREPPACRMPTPLLCMDPHPLPPQLFPSATREETVTPQDSCFCPKAQMAPQPFLLVLPGARPFPTPAPSQALALNASYRRGSENGVIKTKTKQTL